MAGRRVAFMVIIGAAVVGLLAAVAMRNDPDETDSAGSDPTPTNASTTTTTRVLSSIEQTPEYIASNTPCPDGLATLEAIPVALDIELRPFLALENATAMAFVDASFGFVGQRTGEIWAFGPEGLSAGPVVDLSGDTGAQDDQGLLSLVVDPNGTWLYVHRTAADRTSVISAYPIDGTTLGTDAEIVLEVDQPSRQHNGGDMAFGPDGYLYVSFGDGGGLGDPRMNGQNATTILGSIVRFEPRPGENPAAVPAPGNPFIDDEPNDPFIWAIGVRNPFRLSFDRVMGDLWATDVGQQCLEEINILAMNDAGANLGWNVHEGTRSFLGARLLEHHAPVYEYRHGAGRCAIVGGYVYRGEQFPELRGRYIFSDWCGGEIWALLPDATPEVLELPIASEQVVGFAEAPDGELYLLTLGGVSAISPSES